VAADDTHVTFEQPRSMLGAWLGVVLLFVVFALFVWAVLGMMPHGDRYEQKRAAARLDKLKTVREETNGPLVGYAWVDKAKGTVRIPIERAMELTVAELAQKKPAPANPIAPAATQPGSQETAPVTAVPAPSPVTTPRSSPPAISTEGPDSENRAQKPAEANPPSAAPGTQPGPNATPAASPPPAPSHPQPGGQPSPTPVQSPPGTPLPVPGKQP
jgi:hypothetical protein